MRTYNEIVERLKLVNKRDPTHTEPVVLMLAVPEDQVFQLSVDAGINPPEAITEEREQAFKEAMASIFDNVGFDPDFVALFKSAFPLFNGGVWCDDALRRVTERTADAFLPVGEALVGHMAAMKQMRDDPEAGQEAMVGRFIELISMGDKIKDFAFLSNLLLGLAWLLGDEVALGIDETDFESIEQMMALSLRVAQMYTGHQYDEALTEFIESVEQEKQAA